MEQTNLEASNLKTIQHACVVLSGEITSLSEDLSETFPKTVSCLHELATEVSPVILDIIYQCGIVEVGLPGYKKEPLDWSVSDGGDFSKLSWVRDMLRLLKLGHVEPVFAGFNNLISALYQEQSKLGAEAEYIKECIDDLLVATAELRSCSPDGLIRDPIH